MIIKIIKRIVFYATNIILLLPVADMITLIVISLIDGFCKSSGILNIFIIIDCYCTSFSMLLAPLLMAVSNLLDIRINKKIVIIFIIAQILSLLLFIPINGKSFRDILYD